MNRGVVVLVSSVISLGAFLVWDLQSEKSKEEQKSQEALIFPFKADQVNEILIENAKFKTQIVRTVDGWKIETPLQDGADDSFTDDVVERGVKDKWIEVAKEGDIDWKIYGLDQPVGKITLKTQTGESRTLEVSAKQNFEQNAIARLTGEDRVLIVPFGWSATVGRGPLDFRDKRLFRPRVASIDRIEFSNARGSFVLMQKDGQWMVPANSEMKLDQNRVRELLSTISETRASDFVHEGRAVDNAQRRAAGLEKPVVSIRARLKGRFWTADFGRGDDKADAARAGEFAGISEPLSLLKLEPGSIAKFEKISLDGLRDKKLPFEFDKAAVRKLEIVTPLKTSVFTKDGEAWRLSQAEGLEVDGAKVSGLIDQLRSTAALRYADGRTQGRFRSQNKIRLFDEGDAPVFEAIWGGSFKDKGDEEGPSLVVVKTSKSQEMVVLDESVTGPWTGQQLVKAPAVPAPEPTSAPSPTDGAPSQGAAPSEAVDR